MPHANINGASLYYAEQGTGPAILFHHGYTGSHDSWDVVAPAFAAKGYRAIVMDCRGAGDSEHTADGYSIEQYADDVIGMADHLGLDRFIYVGHSMGGVIGMELGIRYASRLEKLVLVAPAPADGVDVSVPGAAAQRERGLALRRARDRETLLRERLATTARPNPETIAAAVDRALSVSDGHYNDSWDALVTSRRGDRLEEIMVPTLLVAGAADGLLLANLRDYPRLGNATIHVLSRVSHGIHQEDPDTFITVLGDFLDHGVVTQATLVRRFREMAAAR
ncbi:MAG TPA: alpha/beta hydrolase [Tepidiformaceae bacterium]|nr:alpha/beta hydrolase [Tepidiformaceae bacterium]